MAPPVMDATSASVRVNGYNSAMAFESYSLDGYAVYGNDYGTAPARGYGGYFQSTSGIGVYGYTSSGRTVNNNLAPGVYGKSLNGVGVYGLSLGNDSSAVGGQFEGQTGLRARATGSNQSYAGIFTSNYRGLYARSYGGFYDAYFDGATGVYSAGGFYPAGSDFAELLPASSNLAAADVLVIAADGSLQLSSEAFASNVAGVYSTKPGILAGASAEEGLDGKVPLAVVGIVPVKASAENGSITPGDLLVSAATPGHAMKAGAAPPQGTVIGKALQPLEHDTGIIRMLATLQ
jgi:hypothetical protein